MYVRRTYLQTDGGPRGSKRNFAHNKFDNRNSYNDFYIFIKTRRNKDTHTVEIKLDSYFSEIFLFNIQGLVPGRWGTQHASIVPYQTFQTAGNSECYYFSKVRNNKQFIRILETFS